jgi:hypothetical protein
MSLNKMWILVAGRIEKWEFMYVFIYVYKFVCAHTRESFLIHRKPILHREAPRNTVVTAQGSVVYDGPFAYGCGLTSKRKVTVHSGINALIV